MGRIRAGKSAYDRRQSTYTVSISNASKWIAGERAVSNKGVEKAIDVAGVIDHTGKRNLTRPGSNPCRQVSLRQLVLITALHHKALKGGKLKAVQPPGVVSPNAQ
jgi:hypothetical protein